MDIQKFILGFDMEEEDILRWIGAIKKGDPRCRFQYGDRVYKARTIDKEELTPIGTRGTVFGSMWNEQSVDVSKDAYWVIWDGSKIVVTTVGRRIEALSEPPRKDIRVKLVERDDIMMVELDNS